MYSHILLFIIYRFIYIIKGNIFIITAITSGIIQVLWTRSEGLIPIAVLK